MHIQREPCFRGAFPFLRNFAQRRQAGPGILPALMIVRCSGEERIGEGCGAPCVARMKLRCVYRQRTWMKADIVAREETTVPVEGGVFHRLGGNGSRKLIEA